MMYELHELAPIFGTVGSLPQSTGGGEVSRCHTTNRIAVCVTLMELLLQHPALFNLMTQLLDKHRIPSGDAGIPPPPAWPQLGKPATNAPLRPRWPTSPRSGPVDQNADQREEAPAWGLLGERVARWLRRLAQA